MALQNYGIGAKTILSSKKGCKKIKTERKNAKNLLPLKAEKNSYIINFVNLITINNSTLIFFDFFLITFYYISFLLQVL